MCRSLCAALQEVHRLLLLLDKLLTEGDEPSPRAIFELLAQLKDQPRVADLLLEMLQTLPPPKPAPPKKGERRQRGRSAEAKTTPETKVDAAAGAAVGDAVAGGAVVEPVAQVEALVVDWRGQVVTMLDRSYLAEAMPALLALSACALPQRPGDPAPS